ncbi:hypothetical protein [Spirulina sp. 06S082]|nr:hypothetical protein [Spirulina sp. 06S082]MEA5467259.1 hypothetical protein [Spirulina sp. 06S082]
MKVNIQQGHPQSHSARSLTPVSDILITKTPVKLKAAGVEQC